MFGQKPLRMFIYTAIAAALFTPLIFGAGFVFPYVLPKALWFQFFTQLAILGYILLLIKGYARLPRINFIGIAVILFFLSAAISTFLGADPSMSFWSKAERMDGLFFLAHLAAFFFLLVAFVSHEEEWLRFLRFLMVAGVALALTALVGPFAIPMFRESGHRFAGTFGNPSFLATYFLGLSFLALTFLLREKRTGGRWYFGGLLTLFMSLVVLSSTRGAWIGFAAGFPVFWIILLFGDKKQWGKISAAMLLSAVVAGAALFTFSGQIASRVPALRELGEFRVFSSTVQTRLVVGKIGLEAFRERPIFGWGPENFLIAFNKHFSPEIHNFEVAVFDRAHNRPIDILVMQGIVGVMAYALVFISVFWSMIKVLRAKSVNAVWPAGILAIFSAHFVQNVVLFEMPTSYIMFFFFLAFAAWIVSAACPVRNLVSNGASPYVKYGAAAFVPVVALAFWFGILDPVLAGGGVRNAMSVIAYLPNTTADNKDAVIGQAASAYRKIRDRDTFLNSEIDKVIANRFVQSVNAAPALRNEPAMKQLAEYVASRLRLDVEAHPMDYDVIIAGASFTAGAIEGHAAAAETGSQTHWFLERAIEAAPRREDAYQQLIFSNLARRDAAGAKEIIERELARYPENGRLWFIKAAVDIVSGNFDGADKALILSERYGAAVVRSRVLYIARVFEEAGEFRRAINWYERNMGDLRRVYGEGGELGWVTWTQTGIPLLELYVKTGEKQKAAELAEFLEQFVPPTETKAFEEYLLKLEVNRAPNLD